MIRCSECECLTDVHIQNKKFYLCLRQKVTPGVNYKKMWTKPPKTHPRWCPKRKEEINDD